MNVAQKWSAVFSILLSFAAGSAAIAAPTDPVPNFICTDLGTLGGDTTATALNSLGQVVGFSKLNSVNHITQGFIWQLGKITPLFPVHYDENCFADGINDKDQIVGAYSDSVLAKTVGLNPALWTSQGRVELTASVYSSRFGTNCFAYAVNNQGTIVGTIATRLGTPHACVWPNGTSGQCTVLPAIGMSAHDAFAINDAGVIVGDTLLTKVGAARAAQHACLWQGGSSIVDLGTLGGTWSEARAINSAGIIVGTSTASDGRYHPFVYVAGQGMADLGTLGGDLGYAYSINDNNIVVGSAQNEANRPKACMWFEGACYDLNKLVVNASGLDLTESHGINNSEQIICNGLVDGVSHGYLLTPVAVTPSSPSTSGIKHKHHHLKQSAKTKN